MKKILLSIMGVICMQSVFAGEINNPLNNEFKLNESYKVSIKKTVENKDSVYETQVLIGKTSTFAQSNIVSYIAENKCDDSNHCDFVKGTENEGIGYSLELNKPNQSKEDLALFLQVSDKIINNQRKFCENNNDKICVDLFDISVINFKQTFKFLPGQSQVIKSNNVTYTINVLKQ